MKQFRMILVLLCATPILQIFAQQTFKNTSLDIVTDIAGIAMGESFVANTKSSSSFFENPSVLPNDRTTRFYYNYRSAGWSKLTDNMKYFSLGITTSNSLGNLGFSYNQFSSGDIEVSNGPPIQTTNDVNRMYMISFSRNIIQGLTAGISAKIFNRSVTSIGYSYSITSNNAFLFDLGLHFQRKGFFQNSITNDNINLGVSIQNIGTNFSIQTNTVFTETENVRLPKYLRIGFAYGLNTIIGRANTNLDLLLTCEYKNLLNPTELERTDIDYWGAGVEATVFKIISLRIGGVSSPEYNILFDRAKFNLRYGIGMTFPMSLIGLGYPMYIKFDFASIPINHVLFEGAKSSLYGFGMSLIFNPDN